MYNDILYDSILFDKSRAFKLADNPSAVTYQVVVSDDKQENDYEKLTKLLERERRQLISDFNIEHTDDDIRKYLTNKLQAKISGIKSSMASISMDLKSCSNRIKTLPEYNGSDKELEEAILKEQERIGGCDIKKLKEYLFDKKVTDYVPDTKTKNLQRLLKQQKRKELEVIIIDLEKASTELSSNVDRAQQELEALQTREIVGNEREAFRKFIKDMHNFANSRITYGNSFEIKDKIEQEIKDGKLDGPYFYIVTNEDHWFLAISENSNVMIIDPSMKEQSKMFADNLRKIDGISHVFVNDKKLQHNSGCCEMYAIMLPYLLLRLKYFNYLENISSIFELSKNKLTMPDVLVQGFSEQAFTYMKVPSLNERVRLLNLQIEKLKSQNTLLYSKGLPLNKIFLFELKEELRFLQEYRENLTKKKRIKGGFAFRYAVSSLSRIMQQKRVDAVSKDDCSFINKLERARQEEFKSVVSVRRTRECSF